MSFSSLVVYLLIFGQGLVLFVFLFVLLTYFAWKTVVLALKGRARTFFLSSLTLFLWILLTLFGLAFLVQKVQGSADPVQIDHNNALLLTADQQLTSVPVPFWFQMEDNPAKPLFDSLSLLFVYAYWSLTIVVTLSLLAVLLRNPVQTARMILAFFACTLISLPFWFALPALSPLIAYERPVSYSTIDEELQAVLDAYEPHESLERFFNLRVARSDDGPITTIPSMHIAWTASIMYYVATSFRPWWSLAFLYFLLVDISAVFTLQHYFVDVLAGTLVAVVAIFLVSKLPLERWRPLRVVDEELRHDIQRAVVVGRELIQRIL